MPNKRLWCALVIVLAACAERSAQSQPPPPGGRQKAERPQTPQAEPAQKQAAHDTRGSESNPIVVRSVRSQKEAADDRQVRDEQLAIGRHASWLGNVTAIVLALQVLLLIFQLVVMERQRGIMDKQRIAADAQAKSTKRGLKQARRAADAAARAAGQATRQTILSLRARVSCSSDVAVWPGERPAVSLSLFNYGGKPASLLAYWVRIVAVSGKDWGPTPVPDENEWRPMYGRPLNNDDRYDAISQLAEFELTPPEVFDLKRGALVLRVFGAVRYSDGFNQKYVVGFGQEFSFDGRELHEPTAKYAEAEGYNYERRDRNPKSKQ